MANVNKVILIGRMVGDPETTKAGETTITKFSVAVTEKYKDKEETSFFDVDSFGKTAEVIAQYMSKGKHIYIEGRLRQDKWKDKATGDNRSRVVVKLENFQFLDSNKNDNPVEDRVVQNAEPTKGQRRPF